MVKELNVSKHNLVPKHIKLSEEEAQKVLSEFNISINQLPMISEKDSAIKELNIKVGDMIKIIRKSPTNIESVFYRIVVHG